MKWEIHLIWETVWDSIHKSIMGSAHFSVRNKVNTSEGVGDFINTILYSEVNQIIDNYNERIQEKKTN
mgnify:CR=1 FL=1